MGLNKDDGESIKNDKRARPGRTALGTEPGRRTAEVGLLRTGGEKTKSFAVISSHRHRREVEGLLEGQRIGRLAFRALERVLGIVYCRHRGPQESHAPALVRRACGPCQVQPPPGGRREYAPRPDDGPDD